MNFGPSASHWENLIRPDQVHGSLYSDPAIFEAELQNIWYRTWVYVGHESEVPNANDYVAKSIGPQSVIMTRGRAGQGQPPAQSLFSSRQPGLLLRQGQCAILHLSVPLLDFRQRWPPCRLRVSRRL